MFTPDQQIGLYKLIRRLGRGGFGEVWLAERRTQILATKVAVKLPLDEQIDVAAIRQEAELWEQASGHPNVLPIIEADIHDGQVLIVSEFAPDGSLADWLKQHGKMPIEPAVETIIKILDGLEFLHSRRIIHRDLKPANILLQGSTPRLADFGISRALQTTDASQSQNVSGTFAYMSPEAFDGRRNEQTDIWAVGVCLYQLLTGRLPYPQIEISTLIVAIMMTEPAPVPDEVPPDVKTVLAKALAKDPAIRYKTAAEMRGELRSVLRGEALPVLPQSPATTAIETVVKPLPPIENKPQSETLPKQTSITYLLLFALVILFAGLVLREFFFSFAVFFIEHLGDLGDLESAIIPLTIYLSLSCLIESSLPLTVYAVSKHILITFLTQVIISTMFVQALVLPFGIVSPLNDRLVYGLVVAGIAAVIGVIYIFAFNKTKKTDSLSFKLTQLLVVSVLCRLGAFFAIADILYHIALPLLGFIIPFLIAALISPLIAIGTAKVLGKY